MKKLQYIVALVVFFSSALFAQEKTKAKQTIEVNGVCQLCKKRIETTALGVKGVRSATWSIEDKKLELFLDPKKTDLMKVEKAIAKAGHDTQNSKAEEVDYDNLHFCCKYDR